MSGELTAATSDFITALDSLDVDAMLRRVGEGAQGVDEISQRWIRGRSELEGYLRQLAGSVSEVRTELKDTSETVWGDTGVLTCWLDQSYQLEGQTQHVSAPTTIVFHREDGEWKLALFHSVPIPETT